MPEALNKLEQARQQGIDVSFDMYPYPAGSSYILQLLPTAALEGGYDGLVVRLARRISANSCGCIWKEKPG